MFREQGGEIMFSSGGVHRILSSLPRVDVTEIVKVGRGACCDAVTRVFKVPHAE